jgi:translation initiation factor eIF-2B subunit alpha
MSVFNEVVDAFTTLVLSHDVAVPVAAMHALVLSIERSDANTWMELEDELRNAIASLKRCRHENLGGRTSLSLGSGCDLFMKHVTRAFNQDSGIGEFSQCKEILIQRGEKFANLSLSSRSRIADIGNSFITDSCTVLIHGNSRVVNALILKAAKTKHFNIICTEGSPGNEGNEAAQLFMSAGIPTKIILDCAVGFYMEESNVDMVLVGAEGVMENGGIVNKTGTCRDVMWRIV